MTLSQDNFTDPHIMKDLKWADLSLDSSVTGKANFILGWIVALQGFQPEHHLGQGRPFLSSKQHV